VNKHHYICSIFVPLQVPSSLLRMNLALVKEDNEIYLLFVTPEQVEVRAVILPASPLWNVYFSPDLI